MSNELFVVQSDFILTTDRRVIRFLTSSLSNLYLNSVERSVILNHSSTYIRSAKNGHRKEMQLIVKFISNSFE